MGAGGGQAQLTDYSVQGGVGTADRLRGETGTADRQMGKGKKDSKQTKVGGKYSRQTSRGLYIGKYHLPPWGGGISADVIGEKI